MSDSTTPQDGNAMSPASVGSQGLDIIDRLRACETRPLVTMSEECEAVTRDAAAWVELWCTLNEARREIAKLRILLKATAITAAERKAVAGIAEALRRLRVYPEQLGRTQQDDVDLLFRIAGVG